MDRFKKTLSKGDEVPKGFQRSAKDYAKLDDMRDKKGSPLFSMLSLLSYSTPFNKQQTIKAEIEKLRASLTCLLTIHHIFERGDKALNPRLVSKEEIFNLANDILRNDPEYHALPKVDSEEKDKKAFAMRREQRSQIAFIESIFRYEESLTFIPKCGEDGLLEQREDGYSFSFDRKLAAEFMGWFLEQKSATSSAKPKK